MPVEFTSTWRKSSYSGVDSNCVEVAWGHWHRSSYSGNVNCVEVAWARQVAGVRDSKNADGGTLVVSTTALSALVRSLG